LLVQELTLENKLILDKNKYLENKIAVIIKAQIQHKMST